MGRTRTFDADRSLSQKSLEISAMVGELLLGCAEMTLSARVSSLVTVGAVGSL